MNWKLKIKVCVDLLMTILSLGLMACHLTGQLLHEWMGVAVAVLIVIHIVLNGSWGTRLFKGKYTAGRTIQTLVNAIIFITFLGLMISGVMISRHGFIFLPMLGGRAFARTLHHVSAYWAFIGVSLHIGLHGNMILNMIRRMFRLKNKNKLRTCLIRIIAAAIAGVGVYAFFTHQIGQYMLNLSEFTFFDYNQPPVLYFLKNICVMGLFAMLAHYLGLWLLKKR